MISRNLIMLAAGALLTIGCVQEPQDNTESSTGTLVTQASGSTGGDTGPVAPTSGSTGDRVNRNNTSGNANTAATNTVTNEKGQERLYYPIWYHDVSDNQCTDIKSDLNTICVAKGYTAMDYCEHPPGGTYFYCK